ncbi:MAG: twin-arginine translocation signal domain-containing protein, partial [Thermodesulfobacteriota bacterium]
MGDERERGAVETFPWGLRIGRREFLQRVGVLGGGLLVYVSLGAPPAPAQFRERRRQTGTAPGD